jgi:Major Facilitator Superfamily
VDWVAGMYNPSSIDCAINQLPFVIIFVQGSLISVILSLIFLPDGLERSHNSKAKQKQSLLDEFVHAGRLALRSSLWPLLTAKVISGVASSIYQTALPIVLTQHLHFDPAALGFTMSSSMFAVAAFGALGMSPLIRWFGAPGVVRMSLLCRAFLVLLSAAFVSFSPTTLSSISSSYHYDTILRLQVVVPIVLHGLASHALATSLTTQTTGAVESEEQGVLLGLEHGLFSLARIGGPPLGAWLLSDKQPGLWSVALTCGTIDVGLIALLVVVVVSNSIVHAHPP